MALQYENASLAFDTDELRKAAQKYDEIAGDLRNYATSLDKMLADLVANGWSTPAGKEFYEMTKTNWSENIEKYAALLSTLNNMLIEAANDYDNLVAQNIEVINLNL